MNTFINNNNKFNRKKVVFIMGATGTGKSRLSVDLATHFQGEIINSDKMQVYKGLEIVTNKITQTEKQGVRHYLLGIHIWKKTFFWDSFILMWILIDNYFVSLFSRWNWARFQLHGRRFLSGVHCLHRKNFEDSMCSNYCWRVKFVYWKTCGRPCIHVQT